MSQIGVLLIDDHAILRSGLRLLIEGQADMKVVGEAGTLQDGLRAAQQFKPDVITLDLSMPGGTGLSGVQKIRETAPGARILVLTMHDDPAYVRSAVAMGASGYLVKSAADSELISAIRTVARGGVFIDVEHTGTAPPFPSPRARDTQTAPLQTLSDREREVLIEVARGYTSQQIADRAGLSIKTIESYRARLMQKLGLHNRADLVRLAVSAGLLDPAVSPDAAEKQSF
ncbi:MAG: response regulator transcription factor [Phycisphaerales bacterium]